ncbi:MAG TPA: NAD(P)/FAD-dependent oxidoreductase [Dehalococcoidales bacterium]|nr:NAD(P)/FAD-dependent oxidoreductase [Dehalococcoidales bacterium]
MHDVVVVGGGPVGSYTAGRLAAGGHRVLVLERKRRVGDPVCCTGIVGQECVSTFAIGEKVITRQVNSASLFSPSGKRLHLRREEPQAFILDRPAFDISLAERAQQAGAEDRFDSPVTAVTMEKDRAVVAVSPRGKESQIPARAVVVAAGFAPWLLKRLGLGPFPDHAVGAQVEVAAPDITEVEVHFGDVAPGFFAWLVPAAPPMARVGLLSREKPGRYLKEWLKTLAAAGIIASADAPISHGAVPLRPLPRTSGERLLAVGDAAGQVKPTSGGGIYYGLLAADMAAATLHRALEDNDLSARRLAGYERAWRKKLGRELRVGYWARQLYERLNNRQIDRLFEIVMAGGIDEALLKAPDLSFDWHSRTILRLLKYRLVSRALDVVKLPFRAGSD